MRYTKHRYVFRVGVTLCYYVVSYSLLALPQPSTRSLQHIYQVQLGRFFQEGEFMPEVLECLFPLVSAAIAVYYRMGSTMLPTPTKSHYTFNIRDVSKVRNVYISFSSTCCNWNSSLWRDFHFLISSCFIICILQFMEVKKKSNFCTDGTKCWKNTKIYSK